MEKSSNLKIGVISSAAVAVVCGGATYAFYRRKYRLRDAKKALNYLDIRTVTTEQVCDEVVTELRRRSKLHRAIGFDCEWVREHGKRQPVVLVQLSSYDGLCGLFRLSQLKTVPQSLKDLLKNETIYKVGVAPGGDAKYLFNDYSVHLKSSLDVRHLAELRGYHADGLGALSKNLLSVVLDKRETVRCSDWGANNLTDKQTSYAAADAHVAIRIFVNLINEYDRGMFWGLLGNRSKDVWSNLDEICGKYVDVGFKTKTISNKQETDLSTSKEGKTTKEVLSMRYPYANRSKPLYHNCFLEAPDGETLCRCDIKKAQWYVDNNLADVIIEDPLTVRLRFEPAARSVGADKYYQLTKENKCVVCGRTNSYVRKNVVPREYRKYFPEIMKVNSSHDVVPLCVDCHQTSNMRGQAVRQRLAELCDAPLSSRDKYLVDVDCKKIRSAARALLYRARKHVLPEARRKELEAVILQHYPGHDEVTAELLQDAAVLQISFENPDYESHGKKVVEHFVSRERGLLRLEEMWREHFLASMRPQHMPQLWSVKHNEERLRVKWVEGRLSEEDLKLIGPSRWLYLRWIYWHRFLQTRTNLEKIIIKISKFS